MGWALGMFEVQGQFLGLVGLKHPKVLRRYAFMASAHDVTNCVSTSSGRACLGFRAEGNAWGLRLFRVGYVKN